jgi:hypothetical protein
MNEQIMDGGLIKADVESVNAIIKAMYESVSFHPGGQPDYNRMQTLFHSQAVVVPSKTGHNSEIIVQSVESFINQSRGYVISTGLEREGFFEREIACRTVTYGSMVHVFSTYESCHRSGDSVPLQRGINSIQLVKDGKRWWILSIVWDIEREGNPLPPEYLT